MESPHLLFKGIYFEKNYLKSSGRYVHRDLPAVHRRTGHQFPRRVQPTRPPMDDFLGVHSDSIVGRLHFRSKVLNYIDGGILIEVYSLGK